MTKTSDKCKKCVNYMVLQKVIDAFREERNRVGGDVDGLGRISTYISNSSLLKDLPLLSI